MADNKKYYYLKLKENFYDSEQLIILQNMQDGYLYSDILMKLYLRSLKTDGRLMFNDIIPYTPNVLAQVVRHQIGTVERALKIFKQLGLIEVLDNGAIYMLDIQNFIGQSSSEGDRKREYRSKIKEEKTQLMLENKGFGQMSRQKSDKQPPEIEKEIEKEIELEKENTTIVEQAISYMNELAGTSFSSKTKKTISLINARLAEGFNIEDLKDVIYYKYHQWYEYPITFKNGVRSNTYYRPNTLFSTKFEEYLQQYRDSIKDEH